MIVHASATSHTLEKILVTSRLYATTTHTRTLTVRHTPSHAIVKRTPRDQHHKRRRALRQDGPKWIGNAACVSQSSVRSRFSSHRRGGTRSFTVVSSGSWIPENISISMTDLTNFFKYFDSFFFFFLYKRRKFDDARKLSGIANYSLLEIL